MIESRPVIISGAVRHRLRLELVASATEVAGGVAAVMIDSQPAEAL